MADKRPLANYGGSMQELATGDTIPAANGGTGLTSPGTSGNVLTSNGTGWVSQAAGGGATVQQVVYDSRADLRALSPSNGDLALVESLGLFRWYSGIGEPDDDETCFATASGAWLVECPHWDLIDAMQYPDESAQDDRDEDAETRLTSAETRLTSAETRWPGRILHATVACAITNVASVTQVSFTATVAGAVTGNRVIITPPNALGPRIACFARVTATDTVTIYLNNPSASSQSIATGTWALSVIQEI